MSKDQFSSNNQKKSSTFKSALKGVGNVLGLRTPSNKKGKPKLTRYQALPDIPSSDPYAVGQQSKFYTPSSVAEGKLLIPKLKDGGPATKIVIRGVRHHQGPLLQRLAKTVHLVKLLKLPYKPRGSAYLFLQLQHAV